MKKYLAVVLAIVMVLGLMLPVMAGPFADVPENHWAYEAVKQLAAYGLIQGFPDGTYKGQEPMTRYQMAIVVARLLSDLDTEIIELRDAIDSGLEAEKTARAEEREAIDSAIEQAKNDAVQMSTETAEELAQKAATEAAEAAAEAAIGRLEESGLIGEGKEEPVGDGQIAETPIIEKIIEKHIIETEGSIDPATLDTKVAESIALIDAVKAEFAMELAVLGVRVSALEEQLALATERIENVDEVTRELSVRLTQTASKLDETNAKLDGYIAGHEKVRFSGSSKVSFDDIDVTGPGIPWKDPFDADNEEGDSDYQYMPTSVFNHNLGLKLTANVADGIVVVAGLDTMTNILGGGWKTRTFQLKDGGLYLDITTPGIVRHVRVGNVAEPAGAFTDFTLQGHLLRDEDGNPLYEGALGEFAYNRVGGTGLFFRLEEPVAEGEEQKYARYAVALDSKLALTRNITAGATFVTVFDDQGSLEAGPEAVMRDTVIGANATMALIPGWEASGEIAQHTAGDSKSLAYKLNLDGRIWLVGLDASYSKVEAGFAPYFVEVPHDKDAGVGIDNNVKVASVGATLPIGNILGGDLTMNAGLKRSGNADWTYEDADLLTKASLGATYARDLMGADVVAGAGLALVHNDNTAANAIADSLEAKGSVMAKLEPITAEYEITDIRDIETKAAVSRESVLDLGFEYDLTSSIALSAGYKSYNLKDEDERTEAASEAYSVKRAGIGAGFNLTPVTKVTGSYDYNRVDYSDATPWTEDSAEIEGVRTTAKAGLEMTLTPATKVFGEVGMEAGAVRLPEVDGRLTTGKVGLAHSFTDNAGLELGYEIGMFQGKDNPEQDYKVNRATASLSVSF
jgi:hypothetical protein